MGTKYMSQQHQQAESSSINEVEGRSSPSVSVKEAEDPPADAGDAKVPNSIGVVGVEATPATFSASPSPDSVGPDVASPNVRRSQKLDVPQPRDPYTFGVGDRRARNTSSTQQVANIVPVQITESKRYRFVPKTTNRLGFSSFRPRSQSIAVRVPNRWRRST
jgi:hypothetical protein